MSEIKHTPGPWAFMDEPDGQVSTYIIHNGFPLATVRGTDDMSCIDEEEEPATTAECIANAKLIAAAPELLDVLKQVFKTINDSDEWWMSSPGRGGFDAEKIEEIINKATE